MNESANETHVNREFAYCECIPADVESVLQLWSDSGAIRTSTDTVEALLTRLKRDPQLFILAFDGDLLVGTLLGGWDGWRGNMYRLVVRPSHRRRGIGTQLVRMVEERFKDLGAVRLYALALKPEIESAAADFWKSLGYNINPNTLPYVKTLP